MEEMQDGECQGVETVGATVGACALAMLWW